MKKWLFLLILPLFFLTTDVYADTDIALGGTYKCYNGSTLTKTGTNTWDTAYYPDYMKNYINCGTGWTKVNIEIPSSSLIHLGSSVNLPYSWHFTTSGGMSNWDVVDLNTNTSMLAGENYITGYQTTGDNFHISLINNGDVQSSFWLWFPTMESLSSSDLASFKSAINSGQLPEQFADLESSINSSIENSTQDILDNQNQSTQDIIDNQDKNNQEVVDSIKGECTIQPGKNLLNEANIMRLGQTVNGVTITYSNGNLILNGTSTAIYDVYIAQINSNNSTLIEYMNSNPGAYRLSNNLGLENYIRATSGYKMNTITTSSNEQVQYIFVRIPAGKTYSNTILKIQLEKGSSATTYEPYEEKEVCQGGLTGGIHDVNDSINNMKDSITSEDSPELGSLSDSAGWLPAGPVDSIINLPLTFFNSLTNALSTTCKPVTVPLPYANKTIELPCMNSIYAKIDGLTVWINSIGVVASAFILYKYLLALYKWVDDTLTFRENTWSDWGGV